MGRDVSTGGNEAVCFSIVRPKCLLRAVYVSSESTRLSKKVTYVGEIRLTYMNQLYGLLQLHMRVYT